MKKNDKNLGGGVDAFGLDDFGMPAGLNPMWGAVAGTGVGTVAAVATRQFAPTKYKWSEAIGFGAAGLVAGGMLFFENTRAAGWTALASAFLNNGLRQIEMMLYDSKLKAAATATTAPTTQGVGDVVIEPTQALMGSQMGLVDIEQAQALLGAGEGSDMPHLVGANLAAANQHVQLVGGPALAQHSGSWGATHFSR